MSEDIQVGNLTKPVVRKPLPKKPAAETAASESTPVTAGANGASNNRDEDIAALNAKMEEVLKFLQAIDWKMWVYLKANNYID